MRTARLVCDMCHRKAECHRTISSMRRTQEKMSAVIEPFPVSINDRMRYALINVLSGETLRRQGRPW